MKLVRKIVKVLLEKGEMGRTELSQATNIHYSRLVEQLSLLEQKQYAELAPSSGKLVVRLTDKGREFGIRLLEFE